MSIIATKSFDIVMKIDGDHATLKIILSPASCEGTRNKVCWDEGADNLVKKGVARPLPF